MSQVPSSRPAIRLALGLVATATAVTSAIALGYRVIEDPAPRPTARWAAEPARADQVSAAEASPSVDAPLNRPPAAAPDPVAGPASAGPSPAPKVAKKPPAPPKASAAPPAPNPAPVVTEEAPGQPTVAEERVVALTNAERTAGGCAPVTVDARLTAAARGHSGDMATRGYFAHDSLQGGTAGSRVTAAGYQWSAVGENIAMGYPDAAAVVAGWMDSPGHRANIMNCRFANIGVGLVTDGRGAEYWTQNFGTLA